MAQVSILTATRNRFHYLKKLIDSLIAQTFSDWEMVIVDNASSDETGELVAQFQIRFPGRFQYFRLPSNVGWSPGIALAAEKATGEFFLFIGDDDLLMPEMLEREIGEFQKNPQLGLVYTNMWVGEQPYQQTHYPLEYRGSVNQPLSVADFINAPLYPGISTQTALFRREAYWGVGGLNLKWRFFADMNLWFQITTHFPVTYIPVPLAFFHRHNSGTTTVQYNQVIEEELQYWEEVSQSLQEVTDKRAVLNYLRRRRLSIAFDYYNLKGQAHYRQFRKSLWRALKFNKSIVLLPLCFASLLPERVFRSVWSFCLAVWKGTFGGGKKPLRRLFYSKLVHRAK